MSGYLRLGMKNRFIAARVLDLLSGQSAGVVVASALRPGPSMRAKPANQVPSRMQDHSCCPHIQVRLAPARFAMPAPSAMPGGNQHPCEKESRG